MRCKHWHNRRVRGGGYCALLDKTCSFGVCRVCEDNTAPGEWPGAKVNPVLTRQPRGSKERKPCGDCRAAALIRKSKESQL